MYLPCACDVPAVSLMLTCGPGGIGEAADVADAGARPSGVTGRSVQLSVSRAPRATSGLSSGRVGTHSDPPAQSGDRCGFLLRPVTPAAPGVLVAAGLGLPVGSQTDIPWWVYRRSMRRGRRGGGG